MSANLSTSSFTGIPLVHPTAVFYQSCNTELQIGCVVHPYAVLGKPPDISQALARVPDFYTNLDIGERVVIGAHAIIYSGVRIGNDCIIGDHAVIREGVNIGDKCVIGQGVSIHYNTSIMSNVRIVNGTHITGECFIDEGCFFGVNVTTSNDRRIDLHDYRFHPDKIRAPRFGKRVLVGSGANILAGVQIGDDAIIGAGALITHDVPAGAKMLGHIASSSDISTKIDRRQ